MYPGSGSADRDDDSRTAARGFEGDDAVVPVDPSVRALRESVRPDLLRVEVFAGADHRIIDRRAASFADRYLQMLSAFVANPHASDATVHASEDPSPTANTPLVAGSRGVSTQGERPDDPDR
jgi:hypothetical protein